MRSGLLGVALIERRRRQTPVDVEAAGAVVVLFGSAEAAP